MKKLMLLFLPFLGGCRTVCQCECKNQEPKDIVKPGSFPQPQGQMLEVPVETYRQSVNVYAVNPNLGIIIRRDKQ